MLELKYFIGSGCLNLESTDTQTAEVLSRIKLFSFHHSSIRLTVWTRNTLPTLVISSKFQLPVCKPKFKNSFLRCVCVDVHVSVKMFGLIRSMHSSHIYSSGGSLYIKL